MARVPDLKRLTVEDFSAEDKPLVRKLSFIINSFHEQVRSALNRNLDFNNLNQEIQTLSFTTGNDSQPLNPLIFRSGLSSRVQGMLVVRTEITSNNTSFQVSKPEISWSQDANLVRIGFIGGLSANTGYTLTILTL